MADDKNSNQVLQDCVDELFALQEKVRADQKKFVLESATLIKASQKQLSEAVDLVNKARQSAFQSEQAAKEASQQAIKYEAAARFWKRFTFWTALGFFITGVILALLMWFMGQRYVEQQPTNSSALTNNPRHHHYNDE